jgi:hypothetical protein
VSNLPGVHTPYAPRRAFPARGVFLARTLAVDSRARGKPKTEAPLSVRAWQAAIAAAHFPEQPPDRVWRTNQSLRGIDSARRARLVDLYQGDNIFAVSTRIRTDRDIAAGRLALGSSLLH